MEKPPKVAGKARAAGQYCFRVSGADARLVERCITAKGLSGPSEFWQTLLHQSIGARVSVVTFFDVAPVGRVP